MREALVATAWLCAMGAAAATCPDAQLSRAIDAYVEPLQWRDPGISEHRHRSRPPEIRRISVGIIEEIYQGHADWGDARWTGIDLGRMRLIKVHRPAGAATRNPPYHSTSSFEVLMPGRETDRAAVNKPADGMRDRLRRLVGDLR